MRRPTPIPITDEQIRAYIRDGMSINAISKKIGIPYYVLHNHCYSNGITVRSTVTPFPATPKQILAWKNKGYTQKRIAEILGVDVYKVRHFCKVNDIHFNRGIPPKIPVDEIQICLNCTRPSCPDGYCGKVQEY